MGERRSTGDSHNEVLCTSTENGRRREDRVFPNVIGEEHGRWGRADRGRGHGGKNGRQCVPRLLSVVVSSDVDVYDLNAIAGAEPGRLHGERSVVGS